MRYQPVKVVNVFHVVFNEQDQPIRRTKPYFQARCNSIGDCGHKHRSEVNAEPCKKKLQKQFSERRAQISRDAHARRRANATQAA